MTEDSLFANYKRAPVAFSHGDGVRLWDTQGREYLDFLAGIAVSSLGHGHPALTEAITRQAGRYLHVSNLFRIREQERAGELLVEATNGLLQSAFFCNSGAEAVEAAIKLARRYAYDRDGSGDRHRIVTAEGGFHGRTLGALAATATPAYQVGFGPLPGGFAS
ncbi:MAG: aminotransferase class III-fold pyridoxal phosphate-dependent enzyme, partial [Acidobacteriota bacterium]|nr:aminotransferase class III-fold pyridoxal phosphate-dependent enzyme [Acidobacteriota bacterium]